MASSSPEEQYGIEVTDNYETTCWGCGLRVMLPSCASVFKCGWCGAITDQNKKKRDQKYFRWRILRDRCFVSVVIVFIFFVIFDEVWSVYPVVFSVSLLWGIFHSIITAILSIATISFFSLAAFRCTVIVGGVWSVYPVVFSVSLLWGIFHSIITAILSIATISFFSLAAFRCAGTPPNILWGSYPTVGKGDLENYTFCHYCSKPKSPRAHHCRSCRKCILDMDHHCPFIGNCVGAANHHSFIYFLISTVLSTIYVSIMSAYASLHMWPSLTYTLGRLKGITGKDLAWSVVNEVFVAFLRSALFLSSRGLVLLYLFIASVSLQIGLSILLWQQLSFIYQGKTYLSNLSSQADNEEEKKDCQNLVRFFGFQYSVTRFLSNFWVTRKKHT